MTAPVEAPTGPPNAPGEAPEPWTVDSSPGALEAGPELIFGVHLQERARVELKPDGDFTGEPSGTAVIGNRARLGVFGIYGIVGAHIELQDVRTWGSEHKANTHDEGTLFDASANGFDLHQAYGEIIAPYGLNLRVGRQEIAWNGQRLIGTVGWAHQGRSFDAVRLRYDSDTLGAELLYSLLLDHPLVDAGGTPDPATRSEDAHLVALRAGPRWGKALTLDGLVIIRHDGAADETLATFGIYGKGKSGYLYYEAEAYGQVGTKGNMSILAYLVGLRAGVSLPELKQLKVGAGIDVVSGDGDLSDDTIGSFDTLYATNHKFYGHIDRYLNLPTHTNDEGLIDGLITIGINPVKTLSLTLDGHLFTTGPQDPDKNIHGGELDFNTTWRPVDEFALTAGAWAYIPGQWQAGNAVEVGAYLMTDFTFDYRH